MITEDPAIFLADFGVAVTSGAVSGVGILDMPGEVIMDNMVISTDYTLRTDAATFGSLSYGASVTVNGVAYTVRENRLLDDGVFCEISLQRP
jgi:riboflavin synthase alpha subunit